ncbi:MAG: hypothetical protein EZS28_001044 [Streblomastix strix]|uniref:Uncharacterized protein n=1 Tax=Streblomastix strix TaxID=222440 RepID=A0A5J4X8F1_9EUKA|nr:MAG: hypothetical protein EZS28_001044 [Streblomastix strix]
MEKLKKIIVIIIDEDDLIFYRELELDDEDRLFDEDYYVYDYLDQGPQQCGMSALTEFSYHFVYLQFHHTILGFMNEAIGANQQKLELFDFLGLKQYTGKSVYMKDLNEWKDKTGDIRSGEYNTDANEWCGSNVLLGLNNVDECA